MLSALPTSPWSTVRETCDLYPPLHSLGGCKVFGFGLFQSLLLLTLVIFTKGDRPNNGDVEPLSVPFTLVGGWMEGVTRALLTLPTHIFQPRGNLVKDQEVAGRQGWTRLFANFLSPIFWWNPVSHLEPKSLYGMASSCYQSPGSMWKTGLYLPRRKDTCGPCIISHAVLSTCLPINSCNVNGDGSMRVIFKPNWSKLHQRLGTNHVTGLGWRKPHAAFSSSTAWMRLCGMDCTSRAQIWHTKQEVFRRKVPGGRAWCSYARSVRRCLRVGLCITGLIGIG